MWSAILFINLYYASLPLVTCLVESLDSSLSYFYYYFSNICFITPSTSEISIFGFSSFITALSLFVVLYTIGDVRYKFRIAIVPFPLFRLTYYVIGVIGFGTLILEFWFAKKLLIPCLLSDLIVLQCLFAFVFLSLLMIWIYYAFISPPIFNKYNYKRYWQSLYNLILKGSDSELPIIANELSRSAVAIVNYSRETLNPWDIDEERDEERKKPNIRDFAYSIILLMANRKLCKYIIASSPSTAINFFETMSVIAKYQLPIGQFAQNITTEAIINKDSILYHEDDQSSSGLIGFIKPFSKAIYGNYKLVETLAKNYSQLDIPYELVNSWDASQLEAYTKVVLIFTENYITITSGSEHSYAFSRALANIKNSCSDVYKLNGIKFDFTSDIYKRLGVVIDFVNDLVDILNKAKLPIEDKYSNVRDGGILDDICKFISEIIFSVASIKEPVDTCHWLQHNEVWHEIFKLSKSGVIRKIIYFKLRRLLYNEIKELEKFPNFKSAKTLGFCLNVMGVKLHGKEYGGYGREWYALHKAVLAWVQKHYLGLLSANEEIGKACILGAISFDKKKNRLMKSYAKGLDKEPKRDYLQLF